MLNSKTDKSLKDTKVIGRPSDSSKLNLIRGFIKDYYTALDNREHGDIAQNRAFEQIQNSLGMSWGKHQEELKIQKIGPSRFTVGSAVEFALTQEKMDLFGYHDFKLGQVYVVLKSISGIETSSEKNEVILSLNKEPLGFVLEEHLVLF
jgi:hypothetical protein